MLWNFRSYLRYPTNKQYTLNDDDDDDGGGDGGGDADNSIMVTTTMTTNLTTTIRLRDSRERFRAYLHWI